MVKRMGIYFIGMAITALGIAVVIFSSVGAGPWDAVAAGLHRIFGLTIGMWTIITQALVVVLIALIEKERLQYGAIAAIMIRSVFLDAWVYFVIRHIDLAYSLVTQVLSFLLGVVLIGVGIGLYLEAKFPKTPIDGLMVALHNRFGWSLNISRLSIELSAALLGLLLGGPVGVGTLIFACVLGRVVQSSNRIVKSLIYRDAKTIIGVKEPLRRNG